jgi:Mor family transcriptional regulator
MVLSREEKEKRLLELYYDKGCRYRDIAKELRMSPNQIREIIKSMKRRMRPKQTKRRWYHYPLRPTNYFLMAEPM